MKIYNQDVNFDMTYKISLYLDDYIIVIFKVFSFIFEFYLLDENDDEMISFLIVY